MAQFKFGNKLAYDIVFQYEKLLANFNLAFSPTIGKSLITKVSRYTVFLVSGLIFWFTFDNLKEAVSELVAVGAPRSSMVRGSVVAAVPHCSPSLCMTLAHQRVADVRAIVS